MAALGVNPTEYVERIYELERENEHLAELQNKYLTRTGTDVFGYARVYLGSFRSTGANPYYPLEKYDSVYSMEMDLKSVPVPTILFDVRSRFSQEIGPAPSGNPTVSAFAFDLRWISMTSFNEYASLTAGDFYKHYTPLTLWNYDIPVFTFIEPTPYRIMRKDAEEWEFLDHGPDYRLRGAQISTSVAWPTSPILSYFSSFPLPKCMMLLTG
jgi:hypothetical protein